jgi:sulfide:quinone oxidoreductase
MSEQADTSANPDSGPPFEVLIAGGGVAALEAAFALHELGGDLVHVTMLAPASEFTYRPNAVKEPFSLGAARRFPLAPLAQAAGVELVSGCLERVDVPGRRAYTTAGIELAYDALLLGMGASVRRRYEHVTTVDDAHIDEHLHGLVQDIEAGYVKRLAFVVSAPVPWPLPAYELALLATTRAWEMQAELDTTILTVERAPLAVFGDEASQEVSRLLTKRGIEVMTSAYCEIQSAKTIDVWPGGQRLEFDRIVALPVLEGPGLPGIPHDADGFIPVDEFCHVRGAERVYAAGDATDFPVKHGGIAAQQADTAARSIVALAGGRVKPQTFDPVLEGVLITGDQPIRLRAHLAGGHGSDLLLTGAPVATSTPKISARYLNQYLPA